MAASDGFNEHHNTLGHDQTVRHGIFLLSESDTEEETAETLKQQNILLVINSQDDNIDIPEESGYVVMRWTKDIIKPGAYLTKANIFGLLRRLLKAFEEHQPSVTVISEILLADEYDEGDFDSEAEEAPASDNNTSDGNVPFSHNSDDRDTDEEIAKISSLADYCNRVHKRFKPKAFEFDSEGPVMRIAIDDVLDHSGDLRRLLWGHMSDVRLSQDDVKYVIKEEVRQKRRLAITETLKPCYYPSQEYAASAIIKRIRFIFDYYHDNRQLESFTEFDFRIYTARSNMLEEQTLSRLCDRRACCFPAEDYEDVVNVQDKAKQRVRKYAITKHTDTELQSLEQDVLSNPDKLFLIVADEAHWGISHSTELNGTGANHKLINAWDHIKHRNVVVLLVTATPWNLLTENSRLPVVNVVESSAEREYIVVEADPRDLRHTKILDQRTRRDVTNEVGSVKELHVFKWTENYEVYLKKGFVLSLRVPHRSKEDSIWLTVDNSESKTKTFSVAGTSNSEQATSLLLKGTNGKVTITTADGSLMLTVKGGKVAFTKRASVQVIASSSLFKVHMKHGEDVIELESLSTETKMSNLMYVYKSGQVELGPNPPAYAKMDCDRTYVFLIDSQKQFDEIEPGPQYLSLNFYYNSIRNKVVEKQLIRSDKESNAMFKELQPKGKTRRRPKAANPGAEGVPYYSYDDILAAEYAYYIAMINPIRRTFKTGNVLKPAEIWTLYAGERYRILNSIRLELEKQHDIPPVSSSVFQLVVDYLENKAWDNLQKTTRRVRKNWTRGNSKTFLLSLIGYLLHANSEKLTEHMSEMWQSIKEFQPLIVEHSRKMDYREIALEVLSRSETFRIVNDLVQIETVVEGEMNGHMKVFRASDIASGNRFYATLTLARKFGSEGGLCFFEVIRYFDAFKISNHEINASVFRIWQTLQRKECSNFSSSKAFERCHCKEYEPGNDSIDCQYCLHPHNFLNHFSDLDRLPCILIIVENGRMGDTFPPSFNVMDLRARQTSKPKLSSLQQEIGRLCRYEHRLDYSKIPYVLVAPKLMDEFKKNLDTSPDLQASFGATNIDRYTRRSTNTKTSSERRGRGLEPNRKNYDFENTSKHHNRLLLQAEPQIGKTGVFLKVISLLRQLITKQTDLEETCSDEDDEESDTEEEETTSSEELFADDFQYPYWKTMANDGPLKTKIKGSKYDQIYGPYVHKKRPLYRESTAPKNASRTSTRRRNIPKDSPFRMFNRKEHTECTECLSSATTTLREWKILMRSKTIPIKISVPRLQRFRQLFDKLNATLPTEEQESQTLEAQAPPSAQPAVTSPTINTWIFNPTYRRSGIATVNYHHSMVCPKTNTSCQYVQILVVRSEDFVEYCENWQSTHAILQLPDTLPGCDDVDVNTGGIGFARRAIQMFAEALRLNYIFLLDDNIYQISSVKFSNSSGNDMRRKLAVMPDGDVECEEVSLYTVLKQLESLFDCEKAPKENFLPYRNQKELGLRACRCKNPKEDLHFYSGPSETYGVVGIRKFRPTTRAITRGFKKTHVFSFVLLNIRALQKQNILYNPWQVREDCNLNNDCDERGLNVCKFNRFVLYKKSYKSLCYQKMYFWPDDVELLLENALPKAASSAETTLHWIRLAAPPKRLKVMNQDSKPLQTSEIMEYLNRKLIGAKDLADDRREFYSAIRFVLNGLIKTSNLGKSNLVAYLSSTTHLKDIHRYFQQTNEFGEFDDHLVLFPVSLCHYIQTTKVEHFKAKIIDPVFDEKTTFDVVTSHDITEFAVPVVILYIRGNIKTPSYQTNVGNLGIPKISKNHAFQRLDPSSEKGRSETDEGNKTLPVLKRRRGLHDDVEYEHQINHRKKLRSNNSCQTSSNNYLDPKSIESTATQHKQQPGMLLSDINTGDDGRDLNSLPKSNGNPIYAGGAQINPNVAEMIQQQLDIRCSLDELRIYDRRTEVLRPLQRGATLETHEELVLIARPSGSELSARVYARIIAEYNIVRADE